MSSLKSHITLILALVSILFSIFLFRVFSQILELYQQSIVSNYSIVIVSSEKIKSLNVPFIKEVTPIDTKAQIATIKKRFKNINLQNIKLPYFYKLKLNKLPSPYELSIIEQKLNEKPIIKKVLTHSSTQTKIYNLLMLLNYIIKAFMVITSILGFLLIIKQLEVWKLMHSERMYIMELFGAPMWIKGASLFKIALTNSFIALIITMGIIIFVINSSIFDTIITELNINLEINLIKEFLILFAITLLISFISTILVVVAKK